MKLWKYRIVEYQDKWWCQRAFLGLWFGPFIFIYDHFVGTWDPNLFVGWEYPSLYSYPSRESAISGMGVAVKKKSPKTKFQTIIPVDVE